ncbi:hypothetical protein QBC33DRAFT_519825 [Phialemonium atrogriseum]|uniref:Uncharacterized protein n=1 Tax=Phialemonium atrogriseum TaxID=1093897 RepID=A0AAJ0BS77_9PEZI|nr:uncharacterized protein QBC33DRAFT_519825 [Phialemonium atrogriseum]KAK1762154.1 hypothetical protein QBC33DRAFT_519825 [Phialemonium atrogriseum]
MSSYEDIQRRRNRRRRHDEPDSGWDTSYSSRATAQRSSTLPPGRPADIFAAYNARRCGDARRAGPGGYSDTHWRAGNLHRRASDSSTDEESVVGGATPAEGVWGDNTTHAGGTARPPKFGLPSTTIITTIIIVAILAILALTSLTGSSNSPNNKHDLTGKTPGSPPGTPSLDQVRSYPPNKRQVCTTLYTLRLTTPNTPTLAPDPFEILGLDPTSPLFRPPTTWSSSARAAHIHDVNAGITAAWIEAATPYWDGNDAQGVFGAVGSVGLSVQQLRSNGLDVAVGIRTIDGPPAHHRHSAANEKARRSAWLAALTSSAAMLRDEDARNLYVGDFLPAMNAAAEKTGLRWFYARLSQPLVKERVSEEVRTAREARWSVVEAMCGDIWVTLFADLDMEEH